jgi:hypothetical protein
MLERTNSQFLVNGFNNRNKIIYKVRLIGKYYKIRWRVIKVSVDSIIHSISRLRIMIIVPLLVSILIILMICIINRLKYLALISKLKLISPSSLIGKTSKVIIIIIN